MKFDFAEILAFFALASSAIVALIVQKNSTFIFLQRPMPCGGTAEKPMQYRPSHCPTKWHEYPPGRMRQPDIKYLLASD